MALDKRVYAMSDMEELDLETAPSLDLPALRIEKFYKPKDGGKMLLFLANVRKAWRPASGCPICNSQDTLKWSGRTDPRRIRDITRNNFAVQIVLQSPRLVCTKCNQRFVPKIDGIVENGTMTERLDQFIRVESFLQPHTTLAERTGLSIQTIQNIMDEEIDKYEAMRADNPVEAPRVLGIDEKHIQHIMRGVIVDDENKALLDMFENNSKDSMISGIKKLKNWDKNIQVVTTDMANAYLRWIPSLLPNAVVVIDKYHVIQDIQTRMKKSKKVLYEYRKALIKSIEDDAERARQKAILKIVSDNGQLFNYSMENVVRDKTGKLSLKLDTVMDAFPEFSLLRMLYFFIEDMYTKSTYEEAEKVWNDWKAILPPARKGKKYTEWCAQYGVSEECFEAFQSFSSPAFDFYKPFILNYFKPGCRYTNGPTEGFNNLIQKINTSGNGYGFKHLRAKALYASLVHERVMYSIDISTVSSWKPTMQYQHGGAANWYRHGNGLWEDNYQESETIYSFYEEPTSADEEYVWNDKDDDLEESVPDFHDENLAEAVELALHPKQNDGWVEETEDYYESLNDDDDDEE